MSVNNSKTVAENLLWRLAERFGAQGVNFVVSIILARLLEPEQFGVVSLLTVLISICQIFIDSGLGNSLIQKKDADDIDFSSVFYFNFSLCIGLYILLFLFAPSIAQYYNNESLSKMIRVLGLLLIISGVKNVQQAYVSRKMMFKRFFYSTLGGTIVSAVVGIILAYNGAGAWALVIQHLLNMLIDTIILWITVKWRPKRVFSIERLKSLFGYGWKLLLSSLLENIYNNLQTLIIGRMYSSSDLAYYNKGRQFPYFIISNINSSIDSVLFPSLSAIQDDKDKVREMTKRAIQVSSFVIWPIVVGLAVCAKPLVSVLLTDKWLSAVPFLQMFCFYFAFWPIHTANLNAINSVGRSDIFLRLEIIKKVIGIIAIIMSVRYGPTGMAFAFALTAPICSVVNAFPNKSLLDYSIFAQIKDVFPAFLLSMIMGILIWPISMLNMSPLLVMFSQIIVGMTIYVGIACAFKLEIFLYTRSLVLKLFHKK